VPCILVGTKVDLRDAGVADPHADSFQPIISERGEELARQIGAVKYVEVSAKTRKNLELVYQEACMAVYDIRGVKPGYSKAAAKPASTFSAPAHTGSTSAPASSTADSGGASGRKSQKPKNNCILC